MPPARAPITGSRPNNGAATVVNTTEAEAPRIVFDGPNIRRPSMNRAPASIGCENRSRNPLFIKTGVPLAMLSSTISFAIRTGCINHRSARPRSAPNPARPTSQRRLELRLSGVASSGFATVVFSVPPIQQKFPQPLHWLICHVLDAALTRPASRKRIGTRHMRARPTGARPINSSASGIHWRSFRAR